MYEVYMKKELNVVSETKQYYVSNPIKNIEIKIIQI